MKLSRLLKQSGFSINKKIDFIIMLNILEASAEYNNKGYQLLSRSNKK